MYTIEYGELDVPVSFWAFVTILYSVQNQPFMEYPVNNDAKHKKHFQQDFCF